MNIEGVEIGHGQPCRTVAEISNNHNGSIDRARRLIEAAKEAGADFVKFQAYTPRELLKLRGDGPAPPPWGPEKSMFQLYEQAQTPIGWLAELFEFARKDVGIVPFASFFGRGSLSALEDVDCPAFKVAALDNHHRELITRARATGKPVLASVRLGQVIIDVDLQLYCPPSYPQTSFRLAEAFASTGDVDPPGGFSYHGTDPFVPVIAAARGAHLVECHFQLDDEPSELERDVSLTASQFKQMVANIRATEAMLA
jgi:pseudaminic acid synthase